MKRLFSLIMILALTLCALPAPAEETSSPGFFAGIGSWLDGLVDKAHEAADTAGEWLQDTWEDVKEDTASLAEDAKKAAQNVLDWGREQWDSLMTKSGQLGSRLSDMLETVSRNVQTRYRGITDGWARYAGQLKEKKELLERLLLEIVRISSRESALFIEERAAGLEVAIPEEVQAELDRMKQLPSSVKPNEQVLLDFLPQIGLDENSCREALDQQLPRRLLRICLMTESDVLRECMAEAGVQFSEEARLAQEQLDRFAAGGTELTDEELKACSDTLEKWFETSGLDVMELVTRFTEKLAEV